MDPTVKHSIEGAGAVRGTLLWVVGRPDNPTVTLVDRFNTVLARLAMFLTAIVVLITTFEVVMRYLFVSPTLWVNELTLWLGSAIFLMAGVYTMQRRAHIRITAVYDIVPPPVRKVFDVIATLTVVGYAALLIAPGFEIAWDTMMRWERFGTYWNPPIPATVKPLVIIATFLVAVQAINNLYIDTLRSPPAEPRGGKAGLHWSPHRIDPDATKSTDR